MKIPTLMAGFNTINDASL